MNQGKWTEELIRRGVEYCKDSYTGKDWFYTVDFNYQRQFGLLEVIKYVLTHPDTKMIVVRCRDSRIGSIKRMIDGKFQLWVGQILTEVVDNENGNNNKTIQVG